MTRFVSKDDGYRKRSRDCNSHPDHLSPFHTSALGAERLKLCDILVEIAFDAIWHQVVSSRAMPSAGEAMATASLRIVTSKTTDKSVSSRHAGLLSLREESSSVKLGLGRSPAEEQ